MKILTCKTKPMTDSCKTFESEQKKYISVYLTDGYLFRKEKKKRPFIIIYIPCSICVIADLKVTQNLILFQIVLLLLVTQPYILPISWDDTHSKFSNKDLAHSGKFIN